MACVFLLALVDAAVFLLADAFVVDAVEYSSNFSEMVQPIITPAGVNMVSLTSKLFSVNFGPNCFPPRMNG